MKKNKSCFGKFIDPLSVIKIDPLLIRRVTRKYRLRAQRLEGRYALLIFEVAHHVHP